MSGAARTTPTSAAGLLRRFGALLTLVSLAFWAFGLSDAQAHEVGLSTSKLATPQPAKVEADTPTFALELGLSDRDAAQLLNLQARPDPLGLAEQGELLSMLRVSRGDQPCAVTPERVAADSNDGLRIFGAVQCELQGAVVLDAGRLLEASAVRHRHHTTIALQEPASEAVLVRGDSSLTVAVGESTPTSTAGRIFSDYLVIGVEHIVFGIDHVVFLFALLLTTRKVRDLLAMITSFTLSHSVTLGIAVLGIYRPPSSWIEPLIALTVAYVGVENFIKKETVGRWKLAGLFGLVHGFGFAGALGELGVPAERIPLALFSFNFGVELGQLALLAVSFPLLELLRRREWLSRRATLAASAVVAAAGLFWFVTRLPLS